MYRLGSGIGLVSVLILRLCALKLIFKLISIGDCAPSFELVRRGENSIYYLTGFFGFFILVGLYYNSHTPMLFAFDWWVRLEPVLSRGACVTIQYSIRLLRR